MAVASGAGSVWTTATLAYDVTIVDLLRQLDGRMITRFDGTTTVLHTADVEVVRVGTRLISIGLELVHTPYVAEGSPHLLHDLHVFEGRLERFGGCLQSIHRGVTRTIGCGSGLLTSRPCRFAGFPHALPFFAKRFDRLAILVAHLSRFFSESSESLCLSPGRFGRNAMFLGEPAVLLGILTPILSPFAHTFRLLAVLFRRQGIVRHAAPFPAAHRGWISRAGRR